MNPASHSLSLSQSRCPLCDSKHYDGYYCEQPSNCARRLPPVTDTFPTGSSRQALMMPLTAALLLLLVLPSTVLRC
jgi:hypothetical protein